jgi:chemotaxis protein MotA
MDLGSVVGNVLIWVFILSSMALGVGIVAYIDVPSVLIVIGGTTGALMIANKMDTMKSFGAGFSITFKPEEIHYIEIIQSIVNYSFQARRDGVLSLENSVANENNEFLKKGIMMVVDGSEPDAIQELMETEMDNTDARHKVLIGLFQSVGGFAGAYGLIGTLIGLVAMLVNMSDPSAIGPAMAVALLTTLYGAMVGNMVTGPIASILGFRNSDEQLLMDIIIKGIASIQAGDNPRILESKLMAYLPESQRESQFE